jgi:hypothetical protein
MQALHVPFVVQSSSPPQQHAVWGSGQLSASGSQWTISRGGPPVTWQQASVDLPQQYWTSPGTQTPQMPVPVQIVPPLLHGVFAGAGGVEGTPPEQAPTVHTAVGVGTSLSSATTVTLPMPSHTFFLQSPGVCELVAVPFAV